MNELLSKYGIDLELTADNLEEVTQLLENKILDSKMNDEEYLKTIPLEKLPQYEEAKKQQLEAGEMKALIPMQRALISQFGLTKEEQDSIKHISILKEGKEYLQAVKEIALKKAGSNADDLMKIQSRLIFIEKE